jgi:hypothetical protein
MCETFGCELCSTVPTPSVPRMHQEAAGGEDAWRSWATGWPRAADQALFAVMDEGVWVGIALGVRWEEDPEDVNLYGSRLVARCREVNW